MQKFADLLEKNAEKLAQLEGIAMGQPISVAKRMVLGPAALWRYYAGYAGKVAGESYPPDEDGQYKIVQYEPLGRSNERILSKPAISHNLSRCLRRYLRMEW